MKKDNFEFKKKYGQNFIQDDYIFDKIVDSSDLTENDLVIEIGPGDGGLTKKLSKKVKQVISFEIDTTLKDKLDKIKEANVEINYIDFMKVNLDEYIKDYNSVKVVANLPYYITTPIINKLIEYYEKIDKIVIMVQKEVGQRITASPNSKDYNSFTLFLRYYYNSKLALFVGKEKFFPVPKVDSVVVVMDKDTYVSTSVHNKDAYFKLIKDSFLHKRKNLKNNLTAYDLDKVNSILEKYNLDITRRAEEISLDCFIELSNENIM